MKKIILSCFILILSSSSAYATDPHLNMKAYQPAVKKLGNKASRALESCKKEMECVDKQYNVFVKKREKLVKTTFKIKVRHFKKFAKKPLKKEAQCVKESSSKAKTCFKKYYGEINAILATLS